MCCVQVRCWFCNELSGTRLSRQEAAKQGAFCVTRTIHLTISILVFAIEHIFNIFAVQINIQHARDLIVLSKMIHAAKAERCVSSFPTPVHWYTPRATGGMFILRWQHFYCM